MFWFFLIGVFGSIYLFDKMTRSYLNPYKLIMIFGKKGSGKTTYLTKTAIKEMKKGHVVYSTIYIPGTHMFNVDDIGSFTFPPNSVVLIDEVGMIWDNRDFKNFKPNVRDYFKFQRQYKNKVYLFSQTFDVDLKLRNLTDEMYLLKNFCRVWSIARKINKNITIQKGKDGQPSTLADNYDFAPVFSHNWIQFTWIPRWVEFFKSYDPKRLDDIHYQEIPMTELQRDIVNNRKFYVHKFKQFGRYLKGSLLAFLRAVGKKILKVRR